MFSREARCRYGKNQLAEVICQLRFPEILTISAEAPAAFQEAIRGDYPQFFRRHEHLPPRITGVPGSLTLQNQPMTINYQFATADNAWRVNLTSKFISLTCTNYHSWEDFAAHLDQPLVAFIRIYKPAYFERVGLRYLNFISRRDLQLEGIPWSQLIAPCYLGPLADAQVLEAATSRCSVDAEMAIRGGCRVKIHAGPGLVKRAGVNDQEVKFVFDQDLFLPGQLPVNLSAGALQTLHSQADAIFRDAITDTLQEAMCPQI